MANLEGLKRFVDNSRHVMNISYKPTNEEFNRSAKLIIFSILLIGVMGYVISVLVNFIITGRLSIT